MPGGSSGEGTDGFRLSTLLGFPFWGKKVCPDTAGSPTMYRVLLAVSSLAAGGAERMASELANRWAESGWSTALLTLSGTGSDHYALDPRVARIGLDLLWESHSAWQAVASNLTRNRMIRRAVTTFAPDVVVSFVEQTNVRMLAALLRSGIPVIVCERVDPRAYRVGPRWQLARRLLYPLASAVVVQTDAVAAWATRLVPERKLRVIPNFIRVLPEPPPFRRRESMILAVGRLDRQKGFDLLIEAFAASRAGAQAWQVAILGEGPERIRLETMIRELGLGAKVLLPGVVAEPAEWLGRARVFVLSSRFEGFPNTLLEAMAMGCAVVATDCLSGPGEIIHHGEDGLLVPPDDVEALTSALDQLTEQPGQAEGLGRAAPNVRDRFSAERIMPQWEVLIGTVLKRGSSRR